MNLTAFVIFGIIIAFFLIMAIFLLNGKGAFLIAGFNTMSKEEREKYDEKALCRFVGWLFISVCFCMVLLLIAIYAQMMWLTICGIGLIFLFTISGIIYMSTNKHFLKDSKTKTLSVNEKKNKIVMSIGIIFSLAAIIAVIVLFYQGEKEPVVDISGDSIQIRSIYGLDIDFSDIDNVLLLDKSMKAIGTGSRTNGYGGIGQTLKGHYKSDSLGEILLFVQSKSSPTMQIQLKDKRNIYISFRDGKKTELLYDELSKIIE